MGYVFLYGAITKSTAEFTAWGLFWDNQTVLPYWIVAIIFWCGVLLFISMPFLNDLFIKATNKNYKHALLWQKVKTIDEIVIKK
jgi:hypothetical protein